MTCGEMTGEGHRSQVKRSQSCRVTPTRAPLVRRKSYMVHFSPLTGHLVGGCDEGHQDDVDESVQRLRNFESTKRGRIVNRGDSFRKSLRQAKLITSEKYNQSSRNCRATEEVPMTVVDCKELTRSGSDQPEVTLTDEVAGAKTTRRRRVMVLGAAGVGKTAITQQFQTSEYRTDYNQTTDLSEISIPVTVCLDNMETELHISERRSCAETDMFIESDTAKIDVIVVVYSVTDYSSFKQAKKMSAHFAALKSPKPVILVANKSDLVRRRRICMKEGRALAMMHSFKYVETSIVISSNVDELLAGIVAQTRLYDQSVGCTGSRSTNQVVRRRQRRLQRVKSRTLPSSVMREILNKFLGTSESKSCQNLHTI